MLLYIVERALGDAACESFVFIGTHVDRLCIGHSDERATFAIQLRLVLAIWFKRLNFEMSGEKSY